MSSAIEITQDTVTVDGETYNRKDVVVTIDHDSITVHNKPKELYSLMSGCNGLLYGSIPPEIENPIEYFDECMISRDVTIQNVQYLLNVQQNNAERIFPIRLASDGETWSAQFRLDSKGSLSTSDIQKFALNLFTK